MTVQVHRIQQLVTLVILGALLMPTQTIAKHTPDVSGMKGKTRATLCEWNRKHTKFRCDQENVSTTIIVRDSISGQERLRFTSDARGRFEVSLPGGTYHLESDADNLRVFPSDVTVSLGKVLRTNLYLNGTLEQTLGN